MDKELFCRMLARTFGKYVEVNEPTLQYRAYVWRGRIFLIF